MSCETETAVALPEIAEEHADAWAKVEAGPLPDQMKRAMRWILAGESCRRAAELVDYKSWTGVWRAAREYGLAAIHSDRIISSARRVANLSGEELEHRLVENPGKFSDRDLVVANGVAIDKIAKRERWDKEEPKANSLAAFDAIAEKLAKTGGRLTVTVAVEQPEPAIDVTPQTPD